MRLEIALLYRKSASLLPDQLEALEDSELKERAFLAQIVRDGIRDGEFRAPVDPELLAHDIIMLAHMRALKGWALLRKFTFDGYKKAQMDFLWSELMGNRIAAGA